MFETVKEAFDTFLRKVGLRPKHTHVMRVGGEVVYEFTPGPPVPYVCGDCGATGVRLWREYQTFLDRQHLYCWACALKSQPDASDRRGRKKGDPEYEPRTPDRDIGWLVPARPVDDTFWGQTSGPPESVAWWLALPVEATGKGPKA